MQPLIRSVLDGYNVCIFAYGQTGSGKTHTMVRLRQTWCDSITADSSLVVFSSYSRIILTRLFHCVLIQSGPNDLNEETVGVNYRALRDLFLLSEQRKNTICYDISVQMVEIYNEQVRDLLGPSSGHKKYPYLYQPHYLISYAVNLCMLFSMFFLLQFLFLTPKHVRNPQQFSKWH